ncbi:MAG: hypothetical protein ACRER2_15335 [Methylococcales bacterium]
MAYLDLPDSFEPDWGLASRLSHRGLLEALARALLAETGSAFAEDPIWAVLAELDSRGPGELPGRDFSGSDRYRIPESWVRDDAGGLYWATDGARLRLWSESGYLLVEAPCAPIPPPQQAMAEAQPYRAEPLPAPAAYRAAPVRGGFADPAGRLALAWRAG